VSSARGVRLLGVLARARARVVGTWFCGAVLPVLAGAVLLPIAGCDSRGGSGGDPGELAVVLGTGVDRYEPLEGEPTLTLIKGFQGGFHVWVSFLVYGFETSILRMELDTAWDGNVDSVIPMDGNVRTRGVTDAAGDPAQVLLGWPAVIYEPQCAHGRRIRLDITVRDESNGTEASDTRFFIADVAEADRATSCSP